MKDTIKIEEEKIIENISKKKGKYLLATDVAQHRWHAPCSIALRLNHKA